MNLGPQDGRRRRNHGAMAATTVTQMVSIKKEREKFEKVLLLFLEIFEMVTSIHFDTIFTMLKRNDAGPKVISRPKKFLEQNISLSRVSQDKLLLD